MPDVVGSHLPQMLQFWFNAAAHLVKRREHLLVVHEDEPAHRGFGGRQIDKKIAELLPNFMRVADPCRIVDEPSRLTHAAIRGEREPANGDGHRRRHAHREVPRGSLHPRPTVSSR